MRCEKIQQQCPGYTNAKRWVFVPQYTQSKTSKKGSITNGDTHSTACKPHREVSYGFSTVPNISSNPSQDLESQAICLFMQTFTASGGAEDSEPAHLDFLPRLYLTSQNGSCIREAVTTVSLRNFSNRHHVAHVGVQANIMHGKALRSTNQALANPLQACLDETIATVYLLSLHELLSPSSAKGSWSIHVQGSLQLLRIRGSEQLRTSRGRQIFRLVHTPILLEAIRTGTDPPPESLQLAQKMQAEVPPSSLFPLFVSELFYKVAMLRASFIRISQNETNFDHDVQREILELISQGQWIDKSFNLEAFAEIYQRWKVYSTATVDAKINTEDGLSTGYHYFAAMGTLAHWVKAWTAHMYLYHTLTCAVDQILDHGLSSLTLTARADLVAKKDLFLMKGRAAAASIIRSIPFALGHIDVNGLNSKSTASLDPSSSSIGPMYVMYVLASIIDLPLMNPEQKLIAQQTLQRIGRERGMLSPIDLYSELR